MSQSPTAEGLPAGMVIDGRYRIVEKLGQGGFAVVYLANQVVMGRNVAIKVMNPWSEEMDRTYPTRFAQEAQIAARLHHPNVVEVYDYGVLANTNQPYMVMELLEGHDLEEELRRNGPMARDRVFRLFRPLLDAMAEGHRMGIVHKDLKPANLHILSPGTESERLKVMDFGVARVSTNGARLTTAGQMMGTPRYLAPEYIRKQIVTPAIDVYQIALIMSEALCGRPAVPGTCTEAMIRHAEGRLDIDDFLREGAVGDVFRRALNLDYKQRYTDCGEFAKALDSVASYFGCEAQKDSAGTSGGESKDEHLDAPNREEVLYSSQENLRRLHDLRSKLIVVLVIGVLFIAGVVIAYLAITR